MPYCFIHKTHHKHPRIRCISVLSCWKQRTAVLSHNRHNANNGNYACGNILMLLVALFRHGREHVTHTVSGPHGLPIPSGWSTFPPWVWKEVWQCWATQRFVVRQTWVGISALGFQSSWNTVSPLRICFLICGYVETAHFIMLLSKPAPPPLFCVWNKLTKFPKLETQV